MRYSKLYIPASVSGSTKKRQVVSASAMSAVSDTTHTATISLGDTPVLGFMIWVKSPHARRLPADPAILLPLVRLYTPST